MPEDEHDELDEPAGPPPLSDLGDFELLDLAVNLHRGSQRDDAANRLESVGDLLEIEDSDLESLEGTDVHAELLRRRAELVAQAAEEQARLEAAARESETDEQRQARVAQEAEDAQKGQQELEGQVQQEVLAVNQKFAEMRAGRFQVSRRGTFPHLEKSEHEQAFDQIMETLGPAQKLAGVMQSASTSSVEKVDEWAAADPRTRELCRQYFGVVAPVDLDPESDGYQTAVKAHAQSTGEISEWAQGQLKAHKERTYR